MHVFNRLYFCTREDYLLVFWHFNKEKWMWWKIKGVCVCLLPCTLRYLQEVGYTDTILDVKSQRVKALLGLMGESSRTNQEPLINGTDSAPKGTNPG